MPLKKEVPSSKAPKKATTKPVSNTKSVSPTKTRSTGKGNSRPAGKGSKPVTGASGSKTVEKPKPGKPQVFCLGHLMHVCKRKAYLSLVFEQYIYIKLSFIKIVYLGCHGNM